MAISFTPEALQRIAYSTYTGVLNRRAPYKIDRKQKPFLSFIERQEDSAPLAGAGGVIIKMKTQSNLTLQGWERKDNLLFSEQQFELETQFPWANVHTGWEIVHDDIEAMGFIVLPNQPRGKNFAKADSKSDAYKLVDYLSEAIESMMDIFDVSLDQTLLRDNTANPKLPQGFDNYWPCGVPTSSVVSDAGGTRGYYATGNFGGKSRAAYPESLQHFVWLNATNTAGGSLRQALNTARREAELRSRGRSKGGISYIMAGTNALDKYVKFATLNGSNVAQSVTVLNNGGLDKLDIGIPDQGLYFDGIPIIHNPTFRVLDTIENPTYKWEDRMYLIDKESVALGYAPGKKKFFSAPLDEGDVRVTRMSLDSKLVLLPKIANANAVVHLA